eukprot:scaffold108954_cov68-Phaeocystis_antarctica.AAC.5
MPSATAASAPAGGTTSAPPPRRAETGQAGELARRFIACPLPLEVVVSDPAEAALVRAMQKRGGEYGRPPVVGVCRHKAERRRSALCVCAGQMDEERCNFRWPMEQTVGPYACERVVGEERRIEAVGGIEDADGPCAQHRAVRFTLRDSACLTVRWVGRRPHTGSVVAAHPECHEAAAAAAAAATATEGDRQHSAVRGGRRDLMRVIA